MALPLHPSAFCCNPRIYKPNLDVLSQTNELSNQKTKRQTTPRKSPLLQLRDQAKGVKRIPDFFGHAERGE